MTATHQVSLTLLGAITATALAVTATIASFVVIPTPLARSAEAITEPATSTATLASPAAASSSWIHSFDVLGQSAEYRWTAGTHTGR